MARLDHDDSFIVTCCSSGEARLDSIQEDAAQQPLQEDDSNRLFHAPRLRKRSILKKLKGSVVLPPIQHKEERHWRASIKSGVKESFHNTASFVADPLRSIPLPLPSSLTRQRDLPEEKVSQDKEKRQSRLHALRPFHRSREVPVHSRPLEHCLVPMSVHELSEVIAVPVYKQSSWDFLAVLLDYCSGSFQTGIALLFLFLPTSLVHQWWYFICKSWPIQLVNGYWLWLMNAMQTFRRQAHVGQSQRTSHALAGAALAIYSTSFQPQSSTSKQRRSKWKKRRSSAAGD